MINDLVSSLKNAPNFFYNLQSTEVGPTVLKNFFFSKKMKKNDRIKSAKDELEEKPKMFNSINSVISI